MKSIQKRFQKINQKSPGLSSYCCFAEAVMGQKFSKRILIQWFNCLVEKDDYPKEDKKTILKHLMALTK